MRRVILSFAFFAAACGGGLKYQIEEKSLYSATDQERSQITAARGEMGPSEEGVREAQRQLDAAQHELDLAENEYKQAKNQKDSAKLSKKNAELGADVNQKTRADKEFEAASKNQDAADIKVEWLSKKKKWRKREVATAEAAKNLILARIEVEKARLCAQKGIRPFEKFNVGDYEKQVTDRQQEYNDARKEADDAHAGVDDKERRWQTAKAAADAAKANAGVTY